MKITEIAKYLNVSRNTVHTLLKKGFLKGVIIKPPKGVGGHEYWDIKKSELERYLKEQNK